MALAGRRGARLDYRQALSAWAQASAAFDASDPPNYLRILSSSARRVLTVGHPR
jgi:hypothetical protein